MTELWTVEPPWPCTSSWVGVSTSSGVLDCVTDVPGIWRAALTAASMFRRPAPCWSDSAPMSVAVLVRICFTMAGVGVVPPWLSR